MSLSSKKSPVTPTPASNSVVLKVSTTNGDTFRIPLTISLDNDLTWQDLQVETPIVILSSDEIDVPIPKIQNVYLLHLEGTETYKIGYSKDVKRRIDDLKTARSATENLLCLACCPGGRSLEKSFHDLFEDNRIVTEGRGNEWFTFTRREVRKVIAEYVRRRWEYRYQLRNKPELEETEAEFEEVEKKIEKLSLTSEPPIISYDPNTPAFTLQELSILARGARWIEEKEHEKLALKYPLCRFRAGSGTPEAGKKCARLAVNMLQEANPGSWRCDEDLACKGRRRICIAEEGESTLPSFITTLSLMLGQTCKNIITPLGKWLFQHDSFVTAIEHACCYTDSTTNLDGLSSLFLPDYYLTFTRGGLRVEKQRYLVKKQEKHILHMEKPTREALYHRMGYTYLIVEDKNTTSLWDISNGTILLKVARNFTGCLDFKLIEPILLNPERTMYSSDHAPGDLYLVCISGKRLEIWSKEEGKLVLAVNGETNSSEEVSEEKLDLASVLATKSLPIPSSLLKSCFGDCEAFGEEEYAYDSRLKPTCGFFEDGTYCTNLVSLCIDDLLTNKPIERGCYFHEESHKACFKDRNIKTLKHSFSSYLYTASCIVGNAYTAFSIHSSKDQYPLPAIQGSFSLRREIRSLSEGEVRELLTEKELQLKASKLFLKLDLYLNVREIASASKEEKSRQIKEIFSHESKYHIFGVENDAYIILTYESKLWVYNLLNAEPVILSTWDRIENVCWSPKDSHSFDIEYLTNPLMKMDGYYLFCEVTGPHRERTRVWDFKDGSLILDFYGSFIY